MDETWKAFAHLLTHALSDQSLHDCFSALLLLLQVGHWKAPLFWILQSNLQGVWSADIFSGPQETGSLLDAS